MNSTPVSVPFPGKVSGAQFWLWALLGLAVCLVAISSQSFWIDEAFMAGKASQPTLADWWHMMPKGSGSDLQMPLYMIYMWGFAKIFGLGEWTLRAANIPWFVAGVAAFISVFPKPQRFAAAAVTLLCPFAWFYLNEARPYAMQFGSSLVIFAALYRLSGDVILEARSERNWITAFWLGVIILCGSSLLGVIWSAAAFLSLLFLFSRKQLLQLVRSHWLSCLISCAFLAALAGYYVWTVKYGAREVDAENKPGGNVALTAVKSAAHFRQGFAGGKFETAVAFLVYELLGFSGLGPGRLEIRTGGFSAFRHFAPQLALYALTICPLFLFAASRIVRKPVLGKRIGIIVAVLLPLAILLAAGYFLGFLVLARHCTPLLPLLLFVLSLGFVTTFDRSQWYYKPIGGSFLVLSLISCLSLRFALRHQKDDYRDAAIAANSAIQRGQKVWWSASDDGAVYYHLPLSSASELGRAVLVLNPTPESLAALPAPDLIITSKPDLYDNQEALVKYVRNNPYTKITAFPAFAVWGRQTNSSKP